jgi:hypothetical protein
VLSAWASRPVPLVVVGLPVPLVSATGPGALVLASHLVPLVSVSRSKPPDWG